MFIFCSILASVINTSDLDTKLNKNNIPNVSNNDSEYHKTNNAHSERHNKRISNTITPADNIILNNIKYQLAIIETIGNSLVIDTSNKIEYTEKINALIKQFLFLGDSCSKNDQVYNGNIEILRQHFEIIHDLYNFNKYEKELKNIINATIDINEKMEQIQQKAKILIQNKSSNTSIYENELSNLISMRNILLSNFVEFLCFQKNQLIYKQKYLKIHNHSLYLRKEDLKNDLKILFDEYIDSYPISDHEQSNK